MKPAVMGRARLCYHPLVFGLNHEQRPIAAPIIQIDRLQGEFAGGRWVLANFSGRYQRCGYRPAR